MNGKRIFANLVVGLLGGAIILMMALGAHGISLMDQSIMILAVLGMGMIALLIELLLLVTPIPAD